MPAVAISWSGKHCSDGCPFYHAHILSGGGVRLVNPMCHLDGHKDTVLNEVLDIRLEVIGSGQDAYTPRAKNCPFNDVHGVHVEIYHQGDEE